MISLYQIRKRDRVDEEEEHDDDEDLNLDPIPKARKAEELIVTPVPKTETVTGREPFWEAGDGVAATTVLALADVTAYCIASRLDTFEDLLALSQVCRGSRRILAERNREVAAFHEIMRAFETKQSIADWRERLLITVGLEGAVLLYTFLVKKHPGVINTQSYRVLRQALVSPRLTRAESFSFFDRVLALGVDLHQDTDILLGPETQRIDLLYCRPGDPMACVELFERSKLYGFVTFDNFFRSALERDKITPEAFLWLFPLETYSASVKIIEIYNHVVEWSNNLSLLRTMLECAKQLEAKFKREMFNRFEISALFTGYREGPSGLFLAGPIPVEKLAILDEYGVFEWDGRLCVSIMGRIKRLGSTIKKRKRVTLMLIRAEIAWWRARCQEHGLNLGN